MEAYTLLEHLKSITTDFNQYQLLTKMELISILEEMLRDEEKDAEDQRQAFDDLDHH